MPELLEHLDVVHGALLDALGLHQHVVGLKEGHPLLQLLINFLDGTRHFLLGGDIVAGRVDGDVLQAAYGAAGDHVDFAQAVNLVPEELHPDGGVPPVGREDLNGVPPDPEHVALESDVVALVPVLHQTAHQLLPLHGLPHPEGDHHVGVVVRLAQAVDAGDRGDHDDVPPLDEGGGGGQAQAVDLVVHRRVLLDEGVGVGDIGLGLVVVVVADEVLHGVVGKELLELGAELGGQGLVVGQHQGGLLDLLDDLGHGEGLARAGDAQEGLLAQAVFHPCRQGLNGLGLVAAGLKGTDHFQFRHGRTSSPPNQIGPLYQNICSIATGNCGSSLF